MEVLESLGSSPAGLSSDEAGMRLQAIGPNVLRRAKGDGPWHILLRQVNDPLIYVLLGAVALAVLMGKVVDGLVVLGVVVLNTIIGFVQEYRAGQAIEALMDMVPQTATVLRDGGKATLSAAELVPGDVVQLASGDRVPADMRLVSARSLKVDEAALTGESVPVDKRIEPLVEETPLADRNNMVYGGTLVTYGTGTAVVVATANDTELGRISSMLHETTSVETPLTRQLAVVGKWLTLAIVTVAAVLFVVGMLRGYPVVEATLAAITLAVGAIPEGLPAIVTIALAIGVRRMASRRAVIRRLPAVETLGSTTVICTDKTGTLTKNEMTVKEFMTPEGAYAVTGAGYAPEGYLLDEDGAKLGEAPLDVRELLLAGVLCNDGTLQRESDGWRMTGDPTEVALLIAAQKLGIEVEEARRKCRRLDAVPFESERKYMATLHETAGSGQVIYLKGAPEVVLRRCESSGNSADAERVLDQVEKMATRGMRVLALAEKRLEEQIPELRENHLEGGFRLLGLQGMIDPPRPEAVEAVEACRQAGITVKMITGDHAGTAAAIGGELGLATDGSALTGPGITALSDDELREETARTGVFARVAPEHKLRLVRSLQAQNEIVAMTGDGVNDAPALKQANIGVAMGITGTDASKEAADIVLTDDNFASITAAVEEGRRVYDNLIKALAFVLPTNIGLAVIMTVAVAFFPIVDGAPLLPMLPTQILWINLVAAVALALPLASEVMEPEVMRRPPRDPRAPVLSRFVIFRTAFVAPLMAAGALGLFLYEFGTETARGAVFETALSEAQTTAVTTVILFQIFYLFNCRSLRHSVRKIGLWSNPWIYAGIGTLLLLQLGFVYLPFMNALFGTAPLSWESLLRSLLVAVVVLPIISAEKWIRG
ncbi:MAG: HAD-IC family P-type ATPase, partial [Actinomycetota bacterium]|nr:HAD-IC family P-type ATPase [Actinomycetota bacterium]